MKDTAVNCGDETAVHTDATVYKVTNVESSVTDNYTDDNTNTAWAVMGGKVLKVATMGAKATFVTTQAHDFTLVAANNTYVAGKLDSVKCKNCDVKAIYATVVPAGYESVAVAAVNGTVYGFENAASTYTTGFWYLSSGTPAAGTTAAEGVTSAKTFDAGVALYAGMALMSVAGSAVVIGKKKEF